jgi:hypothetical protein
MMTDIIGTCPELWESTITACAHSAGAPLREQLPDDLLRTRKATT